MLLNEALSIIDLRNQLVERHIDQQLRHFTYATFNFRYSDLATIYSQYCSN